MNHLPTLINQPLRLQDSDKQTRKEFVQAVLEQLNEGTVNPLDLHLQVKCLEEILKTLTSKDEYKAHVLDEAHKHGAKTFKYGNAEVQVKEAGVSYSYEACGDGEWEELSQQLLAAKNALKEREKFLLSVPKEGVELRYRDELITVYPPVKNSTTTVTINLK